MKCPFKWHNRLLAVPQDGHASEETERSERNGKKQEAEEKLGRRRERREGLNPVVRMQSLFFPPLSSFPLGHFALSIPAELRLD